MHHNCQAEGVLVPSVGQFNVLPTGTVILNVDFAAGALTSGSINFPSGSFTPALNIFLDPTSISSTGFSALVTSPDVGSVNGAFYGPAAESAAGNFEVMVSTDRFIGVFGGDR